MWSPSIEVLNPYIATVESVARELKKKRECLVCHNKDCRRMNVVRRTCGYLGEKFWNVGKTKEIKSRVTHP